MNKRLRIFLVATLTPIGVSAELLVPTFSGIRPLLNNRGGRVTPVIFREEQGPGYGKGTAQSITPGPLGALKLTGQRWYSPDDRTIDAEHDENGYPKKDTGGVIPDVTVETTPEQEKAIRNAIVREMYGAPATDRPADPALEKAVEVLERRSAS